MSHFGQLLGRWSPRGALGLDPFSIFVRCSRHPGDILAAADCITQCGRENGRGVYYAYDDVNRLTSETWFDADSPAIHAFEWDNDYVGNRTYQRADADRTYYEHNGATELTKLHEFDADTWSHFAYDSRGNCLQIKDLDGTIYFMYSDANLVTESKQKSGVMNHFYYDVQLHRCGIQDSDGLSYFRWDHNGVNLVSERTAAGTLTADYAHGYTRINGIGSLAAARKLNGGATYQYPVYDHRGSVARLVDENESTTATYEYNAWGDVLCEEETDATSRFRYQSNWIWLNGFGLSTTRLHHAGVGRFLQRDPILRAGHWNLYV